MENDRRDFGRRADCQCRTMTRLLAISDGLNARDLADEYLSLAGAQRILRRFALKGFVRRNRNGWVGTPLLAGCPLVPTSDSP